MAMLCLSIKAFGKEQTKEFYPMHNYNVEGTDYDFNGEELKYSLHWWIFHIADAKSWITKENKNGILYYKFQSKVKTAGVVAFFKGVEDEGYSLWDTRFLSPRKTFLSQREKRYIRDKLFSYDLENMTLTVVSKKPGEKEKIKTYEIPAIPVEDIMTGIYFFRKYGIFEIGAETVFPVFTGSRFINTKVKVLKKEKVKVPAGTFETFKCALSGEVTPKGVFKMDKDVYMWLTTDERHLPVKIEGEVLIGSVVAELIRYKKGVKK